MNKFDNLSFIDNPAIASRADKFIRLDVDVHAVLNSWRLSMFAHEWLHPDGGMKNPDDLPPGEQAKRAAVDTLLAKDEPLERPVLGIGLLENVEIGVGRAVFLTLASYGVRTIPVHIPKSNKEEFEPFLAEAENKTKAHAESGNVFFYLLTAIVLLAALAFAVSQGSRSSIDSLTEDRRSLLVTDILEYSDTIKNAVAQLRLRRVAVADMRFAHPDLNATYGVYAANPANEIFNPSGGGILYQAPPEDATVAGGDWIFTASNEIEDIGSTCAGDNCTELVMISPALAQNVCLAINGRLGIANPSGDAPTDSAIDTTTLYDGTMTYAETIGDEASSANLQFKRAGCVKNSSTSNYHYFQVLYAR